MKKINSNFLLFVLFFIILFSAYIIGISDIIIKGYSPSTPDSGASALVFVNSYRISWMCLYFFMLLIVSMGIFFNKKIINMTDKNGKIIIISIIISSSVVFVFNLFKNWNFELDDKWVYFRTSRNILEYGLPYWNFNDKLNVNSSFLWPYLTLLGYIFGDWNLFTKIIGIISIFSVAVLFLRGFNNVYVAAFGYAGIMLFVPSTLWSLGGLETTFSALILIIALYQFKHKYLNYTPWVMLGAMMWLRPDTIIIGVIVYALFFLNANISISKKFKIGFAFALPIIIFLLFNYFLFTRPFPSPYYVKGLNKAFSGHYSFATDVFIGSTHFLSCLSVCLPIFLTLVIASFFILKNYALWRRSETWMFIGCLSHSVYVITCGYQHMNFCFRYWIPSLIPAFYLALCLINEENTVFNQGKFFNNPVFLVVIIIQIPYSIFLTNYLQNYDISLTRSRLKDRFSVASYAEYMHSWLKAGQYMRNTFKPDDKVFLFQNLAGVSMTNSYTLDQFYMPMKFSGYQDISIRSVKYGNAYNFQDFNWIIAFGNQQDNRFPLHELDYNFINSEFNIGNTLKIYRRKDNWYLLPEIQN